MGQAEEFSAAAFDVNSGQTGRVDISVTRWSTTAERDQLVKVLFEKGQDGLLRELQNVRPVGRIHSPGSIGYELRYAQQRRLPEGGREVVLATDRPMSFWEVTNQPRSSQYPFTWVRLTLGPDGKGEGELAVAAKIIGDKDDRQIRSKHSTCNRCDCRTSRRTRRARHDSEQRQSTAAVVVSERTRYRPSLFACFGSRTNSDRDQITYQPPLRA